MTTDTRDAIYQQVIAWSTARTHHWSLVRSIYSETGGKPSKQQHAAIMAAVDQMDGHEHRLLDLAQAARREEP